MEDAERMTVVVEALEFAVDEADIFATVAASEVGEETTGKAITGRAGSGAGGRISRMGARVPSETVSCSAGEAKECQSKVASEVTGIGTSIVKPVESTLVLYAPVAIAAPATGPSAENVTMGW